MIQIDTRNLKSQEPVIFAENENQSKYTHTHTHTLTINIVLY